MIVSLVLGIMLTVAQVPQEPTIAYDYIGEYEITAYSFAEGGGENYFTAGGYEPIPWWTAAASEDLPFGTIIYIEDIGEFQIQDRGGFPQNVIDIHVGYDDTELIGRQTKKVYIVREE